jgi:hypothetical protein
MGVDDRSFDRLTRLFSSVGSRCGTRRGVLRLALGGTLLGQIPDTLGSAGEARGDDNDACFKKRRATPIAELKAFEAFAACCSTSDCAAPQGGSVTCSNGYCFKECTNLFHSICGSGGGICQECCDDTQCVYLDVNATCQGGTCQCPEGLTVCDRYCVDTNKEPYHCGRCSNRCRSGTCVNGQCRTPESCNLVCNPQHDPDCEPVECPGDKVCEDNECVCPSGMVDCDQDGVCEACGRCTVTTCPPDPTTGAVGECCPDGRCSCGGACCISGEECFPDEGRVCEARQTGTSECEFCATCDYCWLRPPAWWPPSGRGGTIRR